jgi:hypothetical protein
MNLSLILFTVVAMLAFILSVMVTLVAFAKWGFWWGVAAVLALGWALGLGIRYADAWVANRNRVK